MEERVSHIEEKTNAMCQLLHTIKRQNEVILNMMGSLVPSSNSSRPAPAAYGVNNSDALTSEIISYGAEQNSLYADSSTECPPSDQYKQSDHL